MGAPAYRWPSLGGACSWRIMSMLLLLINGFHGIQGEFPVGKFSRACVTLSPKGTGLLVAVADNEVNVVQRLSNGFPDQIWYATQVEEFLGLTLWSVLDKNCFTISDFSGAPLTLTSYDTEFFQDFVITDVGANEITIKDNRTKNLLTSSCACTDQPNPIVLAPAVGADSQIFTWQVVRCPQKRPGFKIYTGPKFTGKLFSPPEIVNNKCVTFWYCEPKCWIYNDAFSSVKFNWFSVPATTIQVVFYEDGECNGRASAYPRGSPDIPSLPVGLDKMWSSYQYLSVPLAASM